MIDSDSQEDQSEDDSDFELPLVSIATPTTVMPKPIPSVSTDFNYDNEYMEQENGQVDQEHDAGSEIKFQQLLSDEDDFLDIDTTSDAQKSSRMGSVTSRMKMNSQTSRPIAPQKRFLRPMVSKKYFKN